MSQNILPQNIYLARHIRSDIILVRQICVSLFISFMEEEYPQIHPKISFSMQMWLKGQKRKKMY